MKRWSLQRVSPASKEQKTSVSVVTASLSSQAAKSQLPRWLMAKQALEMIQMTSLINAVWPAVKKLRHHLLMTALIITMMRRTMILAVRDIPEPPLQTVVRHKLLAGMALHGMSYQRPLFPVGCRRKMFSRQRQDQQPTRTLFESQWMHSDCWWTKACFSHQSVHRSISPLNRTFLGLHGHRTRRVCRSVVPVQMHERQILPHRSYVVGEVRLSGIPADNDGWLLHKNK